MAQLKRALRSESEESPAALPISPIKKRPRTDMGTPARSPVAPEKQTMLVLSTPEKITRVESPVPAGRSVLGTLWPGSHP
ncbi:hypothetical protein DAEQUDRAFT_721033 [Daedalea quercina L-15889]|uniref:Uncharacterized protein n=1 Tax=Daedalea quercina L-15889 TaxID=1314783 RepID=A0A165TYS5_9APHY|nr:hypothetical protein DAEQUDRAFT_721033 [Daedalea quercina L-15889]